MASDFDLAYIIFGLKHSGKTTQGRRLAEKLSCPFVDIDDVIEKQTGLSPRTIYNDYGPDKFMEAEEKICSVLATKCEGKKFVISTGGGICDNAPAIILLRNLGTFVFLDVPEKLACDRIIQEMQYDTDGSITNLPSFISVKEPRTEDEVRSIFRDTYTTRTTIYKNFVDIVIPVSDASEEENFEQIAQALGIAL
ncbi:MAG: hypothetical protein IJR49_02950 [Treponema sp.]|nr:hypothetical protein [Treponema sp.]